VDKHGGAAPVSKATPASPAGLSLGEQAYRAIRDAILFNRLGADEPLREEALAQQLGMSRTPVREALGRLRLEGLIQETKPRGFVVATVSATDVFHVYAVREVLEGFCVRLAAQRITPHQLFRLSTLLDQMARVLDDAAAFTRLNVEFHQVLVESTDNPVLKKIMDDLIAVVARFPVSAYLVQGRAAQALAEHRRIFEAVEQRDQDGAEAAAREHLRVGLDARLAALRQHLGSTAS
jgi:DNA-binding GntR family transcriptional regulator